MAMIAAADVGEPREPGAGVVADSDPTYEYNETVNKAKGMLRAIALAKTLSD